MLSNLVNQLREMDALDKIDQVYAELPRVRKELGQIPLVTPTSQIVGTQTVNNVLFDDENERYKMITGQVKDLCYGLYGKTAVPIDAQVQKKALKGYERGEKPIDCRPAEVLESELEKAKKEIADLAVDLDDTLIYALYPVTGKRFLKWKYGKEQPPSDVKSRTLEDAMAEQALIKKARAGQLIERPEKQAPDQSENLRTFNVFVDGEYFEVAVDEIGGSPLISYVQPMPAQMPAMARPSAAAVPAAAPAAQEQAAAEAKEPKPEPAAAAAAEAGAAVDGAPLTAPMPGMIVSFAKNVGDAVSQGETVVILEAMKMENALPAPASGTIKAVNFSSGDSVAKGDVLAVIG
jgi:oxaloacetate decarboxylase alpha subunit/pyruvate carboxylase subunit B